MTATSEIKQEPDQEPGPAWQFGQSGVINLDSDADDDDFLAPLPSVRPPTTAAQPTTEAAESTELIETPASPPASTGGLNLGRSLFSKHNGTDQAVGHDQDEHAASDRRREAMLKAQMIWAPKLRAQMQARQQQQVSGGGSTEDEPAELPHPHSKNLKGKESDPGGFKRLEARHIWMQKNNKMTLAAEIEFMKAEAAEAARVSKLEADEAFDRTPEPEPSEGIFLSEDEQPAGHELPSFSELYSDDESEKVSRPRRRKRALDGDEEAPAAKRGRVKGAKKARRNAVADTDYTEEDVHDILRSAKSANVGGRKKGAPKGKTGASRRGGPQMTNLSNMVSSNVFEDSAKTKELPSQPLFQRAGGERQAQLKALIASIPTETDKKAAMADKRYLDEAIKSFTGQGSVRPAADGNWTVKGMASTIKHYQILGVAFMRRREADRVVSGGILADAMGLGKTIMMLTNITNGRAKPGAKHKATLIVASPALLTQWASEIEKHCVSASDNKQHGIGRVIRHDARGRVNSNDSIAILESADIVLTTYHEVCRSYPKADIPPSKTTAAQKDEWWREYYEQNKGILHRCRFHRIVLDECQAIKNHRGQTSMACRAIDSKHHWAISGTPVQNTVREFYPYFKFLREPHTGSYKIFKENFCSPGDPEGSEKLAVFLRKLMIRRTHLDTLFNARLLDLPTPEEHTVWLEFDSVERQIYEIIKKRFIQRINTIAKQGNLEKQESHIWTMLLRLRQCCGHILLTQGTIFDLLEREDFERLNKLCEKEDEMSDEGASLLVHLRQVLKSHRNVKTIQGGIQGAVISEYETAAVDVKNVDETMDQTGGKFGLSYKFGKYLESISSSDHWGAITQRCLCTGCRQTPKDPQITSCFHIYCQACLIDLQHLAARRGHDSARCSECGEAYTSTEPCKEVEHYERREGTDSPAFDGPCTKAGKKGKKKSDGGEDWISMKGEVLPSAKTRAVKAQVLNWLEEDPTAKIIIYTTFMPMVRILARVCLGERWDFVKYTGEMSHESRDKAIAEFSSDPTKVIMLASLRCGGVGLNLTMASRVICIDPWWNSATEQQAFCRVFRIGQEKKTHMLRFVIQNSIDAAMMQMKERKDCEIEMVMGDARRAKPTVQDLMKLFGRVEDDECGRPFIFADEGVEHVDEPWRFVDDDEEDEEGLMGNEE